MIELYLEAPCRIKHLVIAYNTKLTVSLTGLFERNEGLNDNSNTSECVNRTMTSLASLLSHLKCMKRMKEFRLEFLEFLGFFHQAHAFKITIIPTLLADLPKSLSRLTIDCYNDYPGSHRQWMEAECPSRLLLNQDRIPSLRHLRLRNRFMCPKIFNTLCSSGESQLETLIINISLRVEQSSPPINKVFFSKECHPGRPRQLPVPGTGGAIITQNDYQFLETGGWHSSGSLATRLSCAANVALPKLKRIKALRIVRHKHPSDEVISHDVLSGRTVILPEGANWEDADCHNDGVPDPDCEEPSEYSFSSLSSDDDSGDGSE